MKNFKMHLKRSPATLYVKRPQVSDCTIYTHIHQGVRSAHSQALHHVATKKDYQLPSG